jgi:hypothetical protein
VPAAVIVTEAFVATARAQAAIAGEPAYPFAVVGHPIGSLTASELGQRAAAALPQVVGILTGRSVEAPGD